MYKFGNIFVNDIIYQMESYVERKTVLRYLKKFGKFVAKVGRIHFPIYKNV